MRILAEHPEVIVLDGYGIHGTHLIATATIDATVLLYLGLTAVDADSLRRANLHAARAPYAARFINLESVIKSHIFWFKV